MLASSRYAVASSLTYENFPMVVLEALSAGTPVIVPGHGVFPYIVSHGQEGLFFSAGDAASLENALRAALAAPASVWMQWSSNARNKFLREYTEQANYAQLMSIYENAMARLQEQRGGAVDLNPSKRAAVRAAGELRGDS